VFKFDHPVDIWEAAFLCENANCPETIEFRDPENNARAIVRGNTRSGRTPGTIKGMNQLWDPREQWKNPRGLPLIDAGTANPSPLFSVRELEIKVTKNHGDWYVGTNRIVFLGV